MAAKAGGWAGKILRVDLSTGVIWTELSDKSRECDVYGFGRGEDVLVGIWLPDPSVDRHPGVTTDVVIEAAGRGRVVGIDTLNGFEQELRYEKRDGRVVLPDMVVQDYPLILRLEAKREAVGLLSHMIQERCG